MALLTAFPAAGPPDMLCAAAQHASPLSGMAAMYWLMSAFHSAPWLKLISSRCSSARSPATETAPDGLGVAGAAGLLTKK
jgi:hypothetical protein